MQERFVRRLNPQGRGRSPMEAAGPGQIETPLARFRGNVGAGGSAEPVCQAAIQGSAEDK